MSRSKNSLARWWGFALVVAVLAALPSREVPAAILFALSGLGLVWALFFAPVWCGAVIAGFTAPGEFFDLGAQRRRAGRRPQRRPRPPACICCRWVAWRYT